MKSTFTTIFYLKRQVVKGDGTSPIMGRITVDGTQTQFSCKLMVNANIWDAKTGRATGRSVVSLETNRMLDKIRVKINTHYQAIMDRDGYVTAEKVRNAFQGLEHRQHTLLGLLNQHREELEKVHMAGMMSKGTLCRYSISSRRLSEFISLKYRQSDIAIKEVTPSFITNFNLFLRVDKGCHVNTVWSYITPFRKVMNIAFNNGWINRNPFAEVKLQKEETERGFLSKEEIDMLIQYKTQNSKRELVRDLFLFCTFTGLAFVDMKCLAQENLRNYFGKHTWIHINRQKTGVQSNIRLLDIPLQIIEKYKGIAKDGKVFPVPSYSHCWYNIAAIAKQCGITKRVSWHVANHNIFHYPLKSSVLQNNLLRQVTI